MYLLAYGGFGVDYQTPIAWAIIIVINRKPCFFNQKFQLHDVCNYVSIGFFNFLIKLWQLPIKLICLLYWYIVESIFQLHGHLLNIPGIDNVSKLNYVGKQCEACFN
jgi:hypothetical protein